VLGLVQALLLISASIATLAILNTMLLNVYDRRREIGLLRATGMRPRQVAAMVLLEATSLGLLAALVGSALGLALGAITLRVAQSPELPAPYVFPGEALLVVALGALVLVPAVCLGPARRAARLNIVQALSHER
jgi:putative ABC transport system permease protein